MCVLHFRKQETQINRKRGKEYTGGRLLVFIIGRLQNICVRGKLPDCTRIFDQNFRNFETETNSTEIPGKVPENQEIVEFPKNEPFNQKFWIFRNEKQMDLKFPGKYVRDFLFSDSSFGSHHNELDISRKDNIDAYSKMEIL